jgi:RimJ/RimL family protein N-acetyltransferase
MDERLIVTERLELVPATPGSTQAALSGKAALGESLRAIVPATWPPEYMDRPAFQFTLDRLAEGTHQGGWWLYFVILPRDPRGRSLIGTAGYKGPPSGDGTVEVGYGIVEEYRRQGYASETVRGLLAHAFELPQVCRAIAETLPQLAPSIGVLRKSGFRPIGKGSEPGVLRFEVKRAEFLATP